MRKYERFCAFVDKEIHFNRKKIMKTKNTVNEVSIVLKNIEIMT